jgi:hypothetical protein
METNNLHEEQTIKVNKKRYIYPPEKQREYNKKAYGKNKEKERYECAICFGVFTYYNKSHHLSTELHQRAVRMEEEKQQRKMNPPTLDKLCGTIVYLDENHYCAGCKNFFEDDVVHVCNNEPIPDKLNIGEDISLKFHHEDLTIKEEDEDIKEYLINGTLRAKMDFDF